MAITVDEDPVKVKSEFSCLGLGSSWSQNDGREVPLIDRVTRLTYKHFDTVLSGRMGLCLKQQLSEQEVRTWHLIWNSMWKGSLDIFSHRTNIKNRQSFPDLQCQKVRRWIKTDCLMVIFDQIESCGEKSKTRQEDLDLLWWNVLFLIGQVCLWFFL